MAGKGRITRKEIVEDKVLSLGKDYAKSLQPAIEINQKWLESFAPIKEAALEYASIEKQFKVSEGRKEFLQLKQQEETLRKKTAEALKAEQNALVSIQKVKQSLIDTQKKEFDLESKKQRQQNRTIKLTEKEKFELRILNRGKREAAILSSKLSTEYEKQAVRLTQLRRKYKDVALVEGETSEKAKKLRAEIIKLDTALKRVDANVGQFQRNVGNYSKAMASATKAARAMASAMGLVGGAFLIAQVIRDAFNRVREFDKAMQNLAGILGVSREELKDLEGVIIDVAASSIKTSNEVAKLAESLITLGKTKEEVKLLLEPVNNLSIGLETTSDAAGEFLVQTLNAFNKGAESGAEFADTIAKIRTSTALNFQRMVDSFAYLAPIANTLDLTLQDTGAIIGVLNDNGIKAERAGRLMATSFIKLATAGITLDDALDQINKAQKENLSNLELLAIAEGLFGKQSAALGLILADNRDKMASYTASFNDAEGSLDKLTNEQLKSLDAQLKILESSWEKYILELNESTDASNTLRDIVSFLSRNLKEIISTIAFVVKAWIAYKIAVRLAKIQTSLMNKQLAITKLSAAASAKGVSTATLAWSRFNKVLKANALGIVIVAISGLIYIFDKLNKSIFETVDELHEASEEFIKQAQESQNLNTELESMVNRYEELKNKTKLNSKEQKELNEIVKKIAKSVPGAVTEINKYGDALEINTEKTRDYIAKQKEVNKLQAEVNIKNQEEALKELQKQQESFNQVLNNSNGAWVKGFGVIKEVDGALKKVTVSHTKSGRAIFNETKLTQEQVLAYKNQQLAIEDKISTIQKDIELNEDVISSITGEKNARQLATEAQEDAIKKAEILEEKKKSEIRSVENLKGKIKELKDEQEGLTLKDKARSVEISKLIKAYQKEINAILGVRKANKSAEKAARERESAEKKLRQDIFNLESFRLKQSIKIQEEISKNEKETFEARKTAISEQSKLELELAKITAKNKFDVTKEFSDKEIEALLTKSKVSKDTLKKVTEEELLIIEQYQAEKKKIQNEQEDATDSLDVEKIKKETEQKKRLKEKALNDELRLENELFTKKEGIYANEEKAVELRERRIAEIKKKYALEALNTQVKAVEELLKNEQLSAEKRAEYEYELSKIKLQISNLTTEHFIDNDQKEVLSSQEKAEQILDISSQLAYALTDLANAIFDSRIQKIDDEIAKNDEKYEKLLENENLTATQREALEAEQEKKRQELEKKKRKEQRKQAKLNKAMAIVDTGIATALGIMQAYAQLGPIAGNVGAALVATLGAIQIAAILAKPIPKYAKGTENHPGGWALVGEERPEVITEPNKAPYIVDKPSVLDLPSGTKVTPSLEEYQNLMRASILASVEIDNKKLKKHQAEQAFEKHRVNDKAIEEAIANGFKKQKVHFHTTNKNNVKVDLNYALWRAKNLNRE